MGQQLKSCTVTAFSSSVKNKVKVTTISLGEITLEVCFWNRVLFRIEELKFAVLQHPSHYNMITRHPGISVFQAVVSTGHGMILFLTGRGVTTLKPMAEAMLMATTKETSSSELTHVIE